VLHRPVETAVERVSSPAISIHGAAGDQEGKFGLPERLPDNGHSCFALAWFGQMLIGAVVKRSPK